MVSNTNHVQRVSLPRGDAPDEWAWLKYHWPVGDGERERTSLAADQLAGERVPLPRSRPASAPRDLTPRGGLWDEGAVRRRQRQYGYDIYSWGRSLERQPEEAAMDQANRDAIKDSFTSRARAGRRVRGEADVTIKLMNARNAKTDDGPALAPIPVSSEAVRQIPKSEQVERELRSNGEEGEE